VILSKIDELPIKFKWTPKRSTTDGVAISRGGKREHWRVDVTPMIENLRTRLYYVLADAIRHGSISTLRICPSPKCGKYFVVEDLRQHFCSPSCRDTYNNHRKSRLGKHREYYKTRQDRAKVKARRLRDVGKTQKN